MSSPDKVQELEEALKRADERYNAVAQALSNLTYWSHRLSNAMAVMCEAHLAGDQVLVQQQLSQFATAYRRNFKPAGSVH
jgi:hypothetical protein